jgi:phenylalanyl-tRNA synthetase beta chain
VFLESAFFAPEAIAGQARAHGLHTDSSHRFERGVDPGLQARAMERATALLMEIAGGDPVPVVEITAPVHLPRRRPIGLREARICRVLGIAVPPGEVVRILEALGCAVDDCGDEVGWHVTPPGFRFDLELEVDLIEEVGRVHGYDQIPDDTHVYAPGIRPRPESRLSEARLKAALVDRGWHEVITFSFVEERIERLFAPEAEPLRLANPISSDLAVMRSTLWSGMIPVLQRNLNRRQSDLRLFEVGLRFLRTEAGLDQRPTLAGLATGRALPEQWAAPPRELDFFDLKGEVEALLSLTGRPVRFEAAEVPGLHPGQCARILDEAREIGRLGTLHPQAQGALDLERPVFLFELDLEALSRGRVPRFEPLSRFPAIRRDLAVVVGAEVPAARIIEAVRRSGAEVLRDVRIFDVYTGEGVPPGRKSVALGLILQDFSRTLTDEEVDAAVAGVVDRLRRDVGASLRE